MKTMAFWDNVPCSLEEAEEDSEVLTALSPRRFDDRSSKQLYLKCVLTAAPLCVCVAMY